MNGGKFVPTRTTARGQRARAARPRADARAARRGVDPSTDGDRRSSSSGRLTAAASARRHRSRSSAPLAASRSSQRGRLRRAERRGGRASRGTRSRARAKCASARSASPPPARAPTRSPASTSCAPTGASRAAAIAREPGASSHARFGEATHVLDGVGAQIALGDLDQDGVPEIVTSAADGGGRDHHHELGRRERSRRAAPAPRPGRRPRSLRLPAGRGGRPALVAVVESEVWIVR